MEDGSVTGKLRAVCTGEHLKLLHCLDSQRCAECGRPWPVLPEIPYIFIVHQETLTFGPRSRDGKVLLRTIESSGHAAATGSVIDHLNTRRQFQKLRVVPTVQGQLAHLLLTHEG